MICTLLIFYSYVLFARLILSWFPHPPDWARPIYTVLFAVTDPVLRLVRPLVPPLRLGMAALDLSPLLIFVAITILVRILDSQGVC